MKSSDPYRDLAKARLGATRRSNFRKRARRWVPGVVVGSGTLVGTGGLMAWVGHQPGLPGASAVATTSRLAVNQPSNGQVLNHLNMQLGIDNSEMQQMESALAKMEAARRSAAAASRVAPVVGAPSTGGYNPGAGGSGSSGGAAAFATIGPVGSVNMPTIAPISMPAPSPAPATNATTGASHAVP